MAEFKRSFLKALGLETEKIDSIIEQHIAVTDELNAKIKSLKEDNKEIQGLKAKINDLESKQGSHEEYEKLKKEFDDYKANVEHEKAHEAKATAYRKTLKKLNVAENVIDKILDVDKVDEVELNDDGTIKDSENIEKRIQEEWKEFIVTVETKGANIANPNGTNEPKTVTKESILGIKDPIERQKLISENAELFIAK